MRQDDENVLPNLDLNLAIEYIIQFDFDGEFSVVESSGNKEIQPSLTKEQKKLLILKTALSILLPEDSFSYRTASLSKFIEGMPGLEEQRQDLRKRIMEIESGGTAIVVRSTNEFDNYLNRANRLETTVLEAQTNG
jgi:hypothetical protein